MAEVVQTCTLLVTGRLEEVVDPMLRAHNYPAVQLDGLTTVLTKFRFMIILHAMLLLHPFVSAHADIKAGTMLPCAGRLGIRLLHLGITCLETANSRR